MVAWLNLHGVHERLEILEWEGWFRAIGGMRASIEEEVNDRSLRPKGEGEEDGEER